jgi:hypothetical protein
MMIEVPSKFGIKKKAEGLEGLIQKTKWTNVTDLLTCSFYKWQRFICNKAALLKAIDDIKTKVKSQQKIQRWHTKGYLLLTLRIKSPEKAKATLHEVAPQGRL